MAEPSYGRIEIFDGCCVTGNVVGAGSGDIIQWGGKVYGKYSGVDNSVRLGRYASRRGFYYMVGGEFGCGGAMSVGRTGKAHGELWQTGGTVKPNTDVIIGDTEGATGVVHVVGGEMRPNSGCVRVGKNGTLSLSGTADISAMSYRLDAGVLPAAFESNFAVKVGFVRALLEKHGISCERADARPLPENRPDAVEEAARAVILFHAAESMNESKKD